MKKRSKYMLQAGGIVSGPQSTSKPITKNPNGKHGVLKDYLYNLFDPAGRDEGLVNELKDRLGSLDTNERSKTPSESSKVVDDAFWAKYLGLPYNENHLVRSQYRPTKAKDKGREYYTLPSQYVDRQHLINTYGAKPIGFTQSGEYFKTSPDEMNKATIMDPLQHVTVSRGKDQAGEYISIYDKYDLASNPVEGFIGNPYEIYDRYYFDKDKKGKYKLKQQGGESPGAVIEKGEMAKDIYGNLIEIDEDGPSHDDPMLVSAHSISGAKEGMGGVYTPDIDSVLSDSQSQINRGERKNNDKDAVIKIKPKEAKEIAKELGLSIKTTQSISPTSLVKLLQGARDKQAKKYTFDPKKLGSTSKEFAASQKVNAIQLANLATDEDLYDLAFDVQEAKKEASPEFDDLKDQHGKMQQGGKLSKYL